MDSSSKAQGNNDLSPRDLESNFGFDTWENSLSLPVINSKHPASLRALEKKLHFTYVDSPETNDDTDYIFISQKTDLLNLLKYLPFYFKDSIIFSCADHLIEERILFLEQDVLFQGENNATINLQFLLELAAEVNASDIHIESLRETKRVRLRIDGRLVEKCLPEPLDEKIITKIKLHAGMDIAQKRVPQDGRFPFISSLGRRFDLRVSTIPGIYGEKLVIRLLPTTAIDFTLDKIGLSSVHTQLIREAIGSKMGMTLITGPTGSGKTTTLYAMLKELQSEELNIITIEDPVEYRLEGITQVQVNELAGVTFSSALRSFLRQDPDVILIGEIRDQETARIASRAAQTGHLILSTLHSNNVFEALRRLQTLGVNSDDLSSSLKLILSQRLLSHLCSCGGAATCEKCAGNGSRGRIPVVEALPVHPKIRNGLARNQSIAELESIANAIGFVPLKAVGESMVEQNLICLRELESLC